MVNAKIGAYAIYNGAEYKAARIRPGSYRLFYEGDAPPEGFVRGLQAWKKDASADELESVSLYTSFAERDGMRVCIEYETDAFASVGTGDAEAAAAFGLERSGRGEFRGKLAAGTYGVVVTSRVVLNNKD